MSQPRRRYGLRSPDGACVAYLHLAFSAAVRAACSDTAAWRRIGSTSVRFGCEPIIRGVIPSDSDRSCATNLILVVPGSCSALQSIASSPSATVQPETPLAMSATLPLQVLGQDAPNSLRGPAPARRASRAGKEALKQLLEELDSQRLRWPLGVTAHGPWVTTPLHAPQR
jgi:hypothetical protein